MPRRPPARYGYARAATHDAVLAQETALIEAGCETVWKDTATGKLAPRPGWKACRAGIGRGDTLAVTRLAVLAFSLRELLAEAGRLAERGITLQVLDQDVHPGTLESILAFTGEAAAESTRAGLEKARARGHSGGRKRKLTPDAEVEVCDLVAARKVPVQDIAAMFGISKATLYAIVERNS